MYSVRLQKQVAAAVAALALMGAAFTSQAHAQSLKGSAACESAKLSAWFDRQRQLSEGDGDPAQNLALPAECSDMRVSNDQPQSAPKAERAVKAAAAQRNER